MFSVTLDGRQFGQAKEDPLKEEKKLTDDPRIDQKWFSRNHETNEAHVAARERREAKRQGAEERAAMISRDPLEQLQRLDERLGPGVGAKKERIRLLGRILGQVVATQRARTQT